MQTVDQPVSLVQFSAQRPGDGIPAVGAAGACPPVALIGGFELVRDVGNVAVQLAQKCPCLSAPRFIDHPGIFSSIPNVLRIRAAK
jgi:hypothetical protein